MWGKTKNTAAVKHNTETRQIETQQKRVMWVKMHHSSIPRTLYIAKPITSDFEPKIEWNPQHSSQEDSREISKRRPAKSAKPTAKTHRAAKTYVRICTHSYVSIINLSYERYLSYMIEQLKFPVWWETITLFITYATDVNKSIPVGNLNKYDYVYVYASHWWRDRETVMHHMRLL